MTPRAVPVALLLLDVHPSLGLSHGVKRVGCSPVLSFAQPSASRMMEGHLVRLEAILTSSPTDVGSLGHLIAALEQYCEMLLPEENVWNDRILEQWGALEEVYAVALDRGRRESLSEDSEKVVVEIVSELRRMAQRKKYEE